jgi:preprotein translocase SecE subunit
VAEKDQDKKRRVIRKVETVREKSAKTAEQTEKPSRKKLILQGFTAPLRFVGRGFKKLGSILGRFKVMRFIGRILLPRYFRNSWKELRGVTWPSMKQARQLTLAVMVFAIIFGLVVAVLDYGLDKVFKEVLVK